MEAQIESLLRLSDSKLRSALRDLLLKTEALEKELFETREQLERVKEEAGIADDPIPEFQVDVCPDSEKDTQEPEPDSILYHNRHGDALDDTTVAQEEENAKDSGSSSKSTCWNCEGDHMITDCPKPRDPKTIAKNRKEFMKNQPASTARYHIDEPQRFGHLAPGLPSRKLAQALGLQKDQLPSYVYRMRELGYPPGWLKEAEILSSGVSLYLAENKVVTDFKGNEDGEIQDAEDKLEYDVDKLQEWPGFNVETPKEYREESRFYRCPEIQEKHSKSTMIRVMKPRKQTAYVRGEMMDTSSAKDADDSGLKTPEKPKVAPSTGKLKATEIGTPIVSMYSPYAALPSQINWAKDTTDHILFENLPDSTGKWDQMLGLIKKGRKVRENLKRGLEGDEALKVGDDQEGETDSKKAKVDEKDKSPKPADSAEEVVPLEEGET